MTNHLHAEETSENCKQQKGFYPFYKFELRTDFLTFSPLNGPTGKIHTRTEKYGLGRGIQSAHELTNILHQITSQSTVLSYFTRKQDC